MIGRVFLVRHGRTSLNADGRLRSRLDPPLDEVGLGEAAAVAAELWEWRIVKILSSPLLRALQSAGAIAEAVGVPVTAVDDLIDRDYGRWAGELEAAVVARFGSLDAALMWNHKWQSPSVASPSSKPRCRPSSTAM
jgi:probable phosphoglycerate mutase